MVKSLALRTLSHIVDESQLDLVRLDAEMLQVFLDNVQGALAAGETSHGNSTTSGMLHDLAFLARNDFNKRLMVAQGNCRISCEYLHSETHRASDRTLFLFN